ncbi:TetR family transcriptional regulator [Massilia violaceinigra]|uniref:TetR family transcriptional regulator n=1 Tax=Massilia violaceinigra TaxID=2045208 RepID=A0A2D2DQS4_9BURK|nr:TetR/AcrR family transcriptional regulator [Massilia violaceinigra]ATQ77329.1 TetR family transcriptional regulator [Massilia violaceinigra]
MDTGSTRKKQPERVRSALLSCAAKIAVEEGLAGVTVQAVAQAAGVSKGGLFHHFANKQALVESMFDDMVARLDADLDACLAGDEGSYGCFTRAYVRIVFADVPADPASAWSVALPVSLIADPALKHRWDAWLARRLAAHADTDGAPVLEVVRLAADGAWFDWLLARGERPAYFPRVRDQLLLLAGAHAAPDKPS